MAEAATATTMTIAGTATAAIVTGTAIATNRQSTCTNTKGRRADFDPPRPFRVSARTLSRWLIWTTTTTTRLESNMIPSATWKSPPNACGVHKPSAA